MAITSTGYDQTVGEAQWGATAEFLGAGDPGVAGDEDLRVTLAGGDTVAVAAGAAYGWGVTDTVTAVETVTLVRPPSGARYDAVVLRRSWATNTTSVAVVQGGADRAVPTLTGVPGQAADQALALVHVTADGSLVVSDDLRVTHGPAGLAHAVAGMRGPLGSRWVLAATGRRYMIGPSGTAVPEWEPPAPEPPQVPIVGCGTATVTTNQYGSATIVHGLGWTPTAARVEPRLATASGMVTCYISATNGLTATTLNITCKVRTATGEDPYQGPLTYVDWVATRAGTRAAVTVPTPDGGTTTVPGPAVPDGSDPADPGGDTEPPLTSGGGGDAVPRDVDAAPAPQIPIPDTPPIYTVPTPTATSVSGILATAAAEIGVRESPAGSNRVKYWLAEKPSWNGEAWCAAFAAWVYRRNGISVNTVLEPTGNNPYYTPYLEAAARAKGLWYTGVPRPGDMVIFGNSKAAYGTVIGKDSRGNNIIAKAVHVAIIERWVASTGRVQEIGGNTSDGMTGSPNNGGGVYRNVRNPNSAGFPIRGYIRMPTATPVDLRVREPFPLPAGHYYGIADAGSTLDHNGSVQADRQAIMQIQAEVGTAIDGLFGAQTDTAVRAWQKAMFRTQTGRVYAEDWTVLLGQFTAPDRPTGIVATAGDRSATVTFNASPGAQQYTAVIYGTSTTKTATASPITFTGLRPGWPVQITVTATNVGGASPASARSNTVYPTEGSLMTVAALDGSFFVVGEGSSRVPQMVAGTSVSIVDAATHAGITAILPATRFTPAIQQAARNVAAILYDGATYPYPAARANVTLQFTGEAGLAWASNSTGVITIGKSGPTSANIASWLTHEVAHLIQRPRASSAAEASGVIEGIADYVLVILGYHKLYAPAAGAKWWDGYDTTASFFHWVEREAPTPSPGFVRKLNQQIASASWTPAQITTINARGMTVDALWTEYVADVTN